MTVQINAWEHNLLDQAYAPLEERLRMVSLDLSDRSKLNEAYDYCEDLTREHSRTFYVASALMSAEKRKAIRALYAFCRVSDDIVDEGVGDKAAAVRAWQHRALESNPSDDDLVALAWADARASYHVPSQYAVQLLSGVSRDLTQSRYETFAELADYCYSVASTVGLMSMHIIGYSSKDAIPYAVKLGIALQLTNILRDVGEDWEKGRFYLPQEELAFFGLTETDIDHGVVDDRWRAFMQFQIARARSLYAEALPGIKLLGKDGRFAIGAAAELYQRILDEIESNDYDVFTQQASVSDWKKLTSLPGIWWRARFGKYEGQAA